MMIQGVVDFYMIIDGVIFTNKIFPKNLLKFMGLLTMVPVEGLCVLGFEVSSFNPIVGSDCNVYFSFAVN